MTDQALQEPEQADETGRGEQRGEQKVTVEDIGPARKRLTIEVPAERIAEKLGSTFDRLKDEAAVPGFRKGRAPMRLLERRFGGSVRDDVRGQLMTECYTQAVEDEKLDVIGEPDIKDHENIKLPDDGALTFQVEVEVTPEVKLPSLEGIKVDKQPVVVTDDDIREQTNRLCKRLGKTLTLTDEKIDHGDYVKADVRVLPGKDADDSAEPIAAQEDVWVIVPEKGRDDRGHVVGIVVDGLAKQLRGKKAPDTVKVSLTGPEGHEEEKIKGQPITIVINIKSIDRITPATVEEAWKGQGFESQDQLSDHIRLALIERGEREQLTAMRNQVSEYLLDKVSLELPENMTQRQSARTLRRQAMELAYRGMDRQQIEQQVAEMRESSMEQARKRLKLFFILDRAAKDLEVDVTEGELNSRISMMAMQEGRRPEKMRQQLQRSGEIEHLYMLMREQKTLDKVIEKAKVDEKTAATDKKPKPAGKTPKKTAEKPSDKPEAKSEKKKTTKKSTKKSPKKAPPKKKKDGD